MKYFILLTVAVWFSVGCSYVTSSAPTTETVNGDVWYVKTKGIGALVFAADIYYCPKTAGSEAATCQQATIVQNEGGGAQADFNTGYADPNGFGAQPQGTMPAYGAPMQPGMQQPGMPAQPGMQQPGMPMQPGMQQPGMPAQPGMQQPGMPAQPGMQQPGMPAQPGVSGSGEATYGL
ncbi:MAG: hypothetical protein JXX14_19730 [Deltaproteobacteria bacterium]|nr:hypothetical protein [Deltaproteobacteria bacterium]